MMRRTRFWMDVGREPQTRTERRRYGNYGRQVARIPLQPADLGRDERRHRPAAGRDSADWLDGATWPALADRRRSPPLRVGLPGGGATCRGQDSRPAPDP